MRKIWRDQTQTLRLSLQQRGHTGKYPTRGLQRNLNEDLRRKLGSIIGRTMWRGQTQTIGLSLSLSLRGHSHSLIHRLRTPTMPNTDSQSNSPTE